MALKDSNEMASKLTASRIETKQGRALLSKELRDLDIKYEKYTLVKTAAPDSNQNSTAQSAQSATAVGLTPRILFNAKILWIDVLEKLFDIQKPIGVEDSVVYRQDMTGCDAMLQLPSHVLDIQDVLLTSLRICLSDLLENAQEPVVVGYVQRKFLKHSLLIIFLQFSVYHLKFT